MAGSGEHDQATGHSGLLQPTAHDLGLPDRNNVVRTAMHQQRRFEMRGVVGAGQPICLVELRLIIVPRSSGNDRKQTLDILRLGPLHGGERVEFGRGSERDGERHDIVVIVGIGIE